LLLCSRWNEIVPMKAYQIHRYGGPEGLRLAEMPDIVPGESDVVVQIKAASLNYRDLVVIAGQYNRSPQPGRVPLSDGAGEVIAIGSAVTKFKVGDRVAGCFFQGWSSGRLTSAMHRTSLGGAIDGVLAEQVRFREEGVVHLPLDYSFEEGATLPCAAVTAWHALFARGGLAPGETVLLLGTGGVSIFALQLAKAAGAKVIITSSSDEKLQRARKLGADELINYKSDKEWGKTAARLSGSDGADHVVEVGGAGTLAQSIRACRSGGKIYLIGILSGRETAAEVFPIVPKGAAIFGIYVGSREMFENLNRALEQIGLRPVIDKVFGFESVPEAYEYLKSGSHFGKIVIKIN
jgi:NADPH:quinone reductase-like Zn-dependent oxidoreductase